MPEIILRSKIGIPLLRKPAVTRASLVNNTRTGLEEEGHFLRKLTLISAPAGYGKTTLAVEWLNELSYPVAWLSLDETDNDPARFLGYLVSAIQSAQPKIGKTVLALVQSPQRPPAEILLTQLINELEAYSSILILVLDDYHVINNLTIHQQISFLLDHLPANLHLVIVTREDPLIPIGRLRARNQVLEIRQDGLRFNLDETEKFMNQVMQVKLSQEDILALDRRMEGWAAGLQLVGITMQGLPDQKSFIQEFTGSTRFILDYLMEEVVNRQTEPVRDFLFQTSILERLCGPLCDAVTGGRGSNEILEKLELGNMFIIPLDKSRTWYRYHALFAELLRHELNKVEQSPAIIHLHQKASQWFEGQGITAEAIQHSLAAKDWVKAAQLIGQVSDGMIMQGEVMTLLRWLEILPDQLIYSHYDLFMTYVWVLLLVGKYEQAKPALEQLGELAKPGSVELGQVATARAYLARCIGDNQGVIETSHLALALLPETDIAQRSNLLMNLGMVYWQDGRLDEAMPTLTEAQEKASHAANLYAQLTSELFLARIYASRGELHEAARRYPSIIDRGPQIPVTILAYFDLGFLNYEWNELEHIEAYLQQGLELCRLSGNLEFRIAGLILKVYIALANQDWGAASRLADQIYLSAGKLAAQVVGRCIACKALTALAVGDFEAAHHWLDQNRDNMDSHPFYRFVNLIRPRLLIAEGKTWLAAEELEQSYLDATQFHSGYAQIAVRVLQALAAPAPQKGLEYLADALHKGQPEGYVRTFVDAGIGLVPLLQEAVKQGITPAYSEKILAAFGGRPKPSPGRVKLIEPLSEREVEVLTLVTAGLSNREIARKLFISPGTAKTHIHNLCGKLGVRNRTEAAIRARELGLA
ncbi:MAG TPA: LuxR C-terminal-related transcriptional regulator [Anaerolineales bacterium]|nr:LuxR C-terminal-related transcriptional regulator [Anaerolineales bacterium]